MYYVREYITLSDGVKPQEKTLAERNDIGVKYNLVNNLGFNLCVALKGAKGILTVTSK